MCYCCYCCCCVCHPFMLVMRPLPTAVRQPERDSDVRLELEVGSPQSVGTSAASESGDLCTQLWLLTAWYSYWSHLYSDVNNCWRGSLFCPCRGGVCACVRVCRCRWGKLPPSRVSYFMASNVKSLAQFYGFPRLLWWFVFRLDVPSRIPCVRDRSSVVQLVGWWWFNTDGAERAGVLWGDCRDAGRVRSMMYRAVVTGLGYFSLYCAVHEVFPTYEG